MAGNATEDRGHAKGNRIQRRRVLQALGTTAVAGLAGCGGDDGSGGDGGSQDGLGERVPTLSIEYWANLGGPSTMLQRSMPIIKEGLESRIGLDIEIVPKEHTSQVDAMLDGQRLTNFAGWYHNNDAARLDPHALTRRFGVDWAGATGLPNGSQYDSCEFTHHAVEQAKSADEDERREHVNQAWSTFSEDIGAMPLFHTIFYGAARTDRLDLGGVGEAGLVQQNAHPYIHSSPTEGNAIDTNTATSYLETSNFLTLDFVSVLWTQLTHSPLLTFDENFERYNVLADSVEITREGRRVTVELRDGTFHNGDPITAEDVKFTFELLSENADVYLAANNIAYESIDEVDDKTVEFNLEEAFLPLITQTFPRWGVLHSGIWEPAMENGRDFDFDPMVGSGPFQVANYSVGESIQLEPHDGHPIFSPSHNVNMRAFRDTQTLVQSFMAGELDMVDRLTLDSIGRIREEMGDNVSIEIGAGMFPMVIYPQCDFAPTMFREFRAAASASIDRQQCVDLATSGESSPALHHQIFQPVHPWRPPEDQLTQLTGPQGDEETARDLLSDAGWGWDDQGRLRYPEDKDLTPRWPQGERPSSENYPCLTEDHEFDPEYSP